MSVLVPRELVEQAILAAGYADNWALRSALNRCLNQPEYRLSSDKVATVSNVASFKPIDSSAPVGTKVFVLTSYGVPVIGKLPMCGAVAWYPMLAVPPEIKALILRQHAPAVTATQDGGGSGGGSWVDDRFLKGN